MNITIIGGGNMGGAIALGLIAKGYSDITVCDMNEEKRQLFSSKGASVTADIPAAIKDADVVIIAVKPNAFEAVLPQMTGNKDAIYITIAAGVSISFIKKYLGNVKVVRTMPNTPAMIGKGVTAICSEAPVEDEDIKAVEDIFGAIGDTACVTEEQMDTVVSLNGSSPAYVYMMIEAMMRYGTDNGIAYDEAMKLVCKTLVGAAEMALASDEDPATLTKRVCSPGGTTIEAVKKLEERGFGNALYDAMDACAKRSGEMTK